MDTRYFTHQAFVSVVALFSSFLVHQFASLKPDVKRKPSTSKLEWSNQAVEDPRVECWKLERTR